LSDPITRHDPPHILLAGRDREAETACSCAPRCDRLPRRVRKQDHDWGGPSASRPAVTPWRR